MDFDLIFQITLSPSQNADQMSHHGDIIKKNNNNKTKQNKTKQKKAYQVSHAHTGWKKDSRNTFSCPGKALNAN